MPAKLLFFIRWLVVKHYAIFQAVKGTVQFLLDKQDDLKKQESVCQILDLMKIRDRDVKDLSGGELQVNPQFLR